MGDSKIEVIEDVYASFARGDVGTILGLVTDDVDWANEAGSAGAPWHGPRAGKEGVVSFFDDLTRTVEVIEFTPLTFAENDNDVLAVVRFVVRVPSTGKTAAMHLHHWFRFRDGKIAFYRGTEDTALTAQMLVP
jgi:hypothetical protein